MYSKLNFNVDVLSGAERWIDVQVRKTVANFIHSFISLLSYPDQFKFRRRLPRGKPEEPNIIPGTRGGQYGRDLTCIHFPNRRVNVKNIARVFSRRDRKKIRRDENVRGDGGSKSSGCVFLYHLSIIRRPLKISLLAP